MDFSVIALFLKCLILDVLIQCFEPIFAVIVPSLQFSRLVLYTEDKSFVLRKSHSTE